MEGHCEGPAGREAARGREAENESPGLEGNRDARQLTWLSASVKNEPH